jgi:DNA-binding response OmpR family regulator
VTLGEAVTSTERILVVEDDPEIQYLLSQILLEDGREVVLARTATDGEHLLANGAFHLVVLDLLLPDADGRTLLRSLRGRSATAAIPVIVVTSRGGQGLRAECFELGADAFVEKPFDPEALASDVSAHLERAAHRARHATQNVLTGLLNLPGLLQALDRLAGRRRALVVAGLDGLRSVSDRHGWGTAEMIVDEVGRALRAVVAPGSLGRTTGGEFAVAVACDEENGAVALAETLLQTVRGTPVRGPDGETFRITASAAYFLDEGHGEAAGMLEAARARVQEARDRGGNRLAGPVPTGEADQAPPLVLLAEDDDITAKILVHRLTKDHLEVVRFDNGNDAYRAALARTPALVILDVKMPGMDGFELLVRLRKTPAYATIPIVILTGMGSEADVVRGFELGADDYLLKPFSPTELLARIRRLLRRGRTAA